VAALVSASPGALGGLRGLVTVHATNGDMIDYLIAKHRAEGKLSPLYHYLSQPEVTEAEASARFDSPADYTAVAGGVGGVKTNRVGQWVNVRAGIVIVASL
jgi:dihydroorotase-like cyclic amidohydrolase